MKEVWSLALELYNEREHVAGIGELKEAERIRGILESYLNATIEFVETPLTTWRLKSVEVYPNPVFTIATPYVTSFDVEGHTFMVEGDPSDYRSWRKFPEDSIAVVIPPGNPDDLKYVALHAWEVGAKGVIVGSRIPRKIVSTGTWGYSYHAGAPVPIPMVIVDEDTAKKAVWEGNARIYIKASLEETKGYTLRALEGGPERIVFTAHYDRWFSGFQDDILGIAQAATSFKTLNKQGNNVELLVFTGEEHGAIGIPGWYWAWGSRWLSKQYQASGLEDNIKVLVNFDVAGSQPVVVSGAPQYVDPLVEGLESLGVSVRIRCCECPECDGFSFHRIGIPSISIHSLWNEDIRKIYHTPLDTPEKADAYTAGAIVEAVTRTITKEPYWGSLEKTLLKILGEGPLIARNILYKILSTARSKGWNTLYKWLASNHLKPVLYGDYRYDTGMDIEATYFPEVAGAKFATHTNPPHSIIEPGEERIIYQLRPKGDIQGQIREVLLDLLYRVEDGLSCL